MLPQIPACHSQQKKKPNVVSMSWFSFANVAKRRTGME